MRLAASPAAAATGCRYATAPAAATGSGCPRLTGAASLKDPILDYRSNDLTAIDRGTGSVKRRGSEELPAFSIACAQRRQGLGLRLLTALV
jgi:hypothetical protein